MLRWEKTLPGSRSRRVFSGTRLSEQPNQRMLGDWPLARVGKSSGFWEAVRAAHSLLRSRTVARGSVRG